MASGAVALRAELRAEGRGPAACSASCDRDQSGARGSCAIAGVQVNGILAGLLAAGRGRQRRLALPVSAALQACQCFQNHRGVDWSAGPLEVTFYGFAAVAYFSRSAAAQFGALATECTRL